MNMLDLSVFKERTWEVKLLDGESIHIKKPTQKMLIQMMSLENEVQNKNPIELLDSYNEYVLQVLNFNIENKTFSKEYVIDNFDLEALQGFIMFYSAFCNEILSDPNLKSLQSQAKVMKGKRK